MEGSTSCRLRRRSGRQGFEVRDGTRDWSAQGWTDFWKELNWGLQAFRKANTKLELYPMQTVERQAASLRAERVEAAARHAREVVERVLWDRENRWEESQRFRLDHHQPILLENRCEQGGRRGVQAGSVAGEIWGLQERTWRSPREAKMDSGGGLEGVEAGPSEAWASKPADLLRHWLGETEDAPEELLQSEPADPAGHWLGETEDAPRELLLTAQEPGEEAGRPRVETGHSEAWASKPADLGRHGLGGTKDASEELLRAVQGPGEEAGQPRLQGESNEAPRERVFRRDEHEGSSGLGGGNSSQTRHHADLHKSEDRLKEAVEAERPRSREASSGAPREQAPQGGEREGWPGSCRRAQHQVDLSRRAGTAVSKKRKLPSGSERWREAKWRPAQRLSCEARTHGFVCREEAAAEAGQGEQSRCQEDTTRTAAEKGESGDESDLLTEDRDRAGL